MCDYLAVEHESNPYTRFLFYAVNDMVEHTQSVPSVSLHATGAASDGVSSLFSEVKGAMNDFYSSFLPNLDLVVLEACISLFPDMLDNVHLC